MKERPLLSEVLSSVSYDPQTGIFTRLKSAPGTRAGCLKPSGYREISVAGYSTAEHRLAWFVMTGRWPKDCVDHRNYVKDDNRWINLREATKVQNGVNREGISKRKKSDLPRCVFAVRVRSPRYKVMLNTAGVTTDLGRFHTVEEAVEARDTYEAAHPLRRDWRGAM